jgi:hypothetical protein
MKRKILFHKCNPDRADISLRTIPIARIFLYVRSRGIAFRAHNQSPTRSRGSISTHDRSGAFRAHKVYQQSKISPTLQHLNHCLSPHNF